jgi:Mg2+ and Co2+ transporter CorA
MLAESQRAVQHAKLVTNLTIVAIVYLPFKFTAGFLGMNFKELGDGSISLWIFLPASLPLMFITMTVFISDERKIKSFLRVLGFAEEEDT